MRIYLAGYIHNNVIDQCKAWRRKLVDYYRQQSYPITWLDPLNGKNFSSLEEQGLKSNIPAKAIPVGDIMSVESSDLIIANMDKFGQERDMTGTTCEVAIAGYIKKPVIVISTDIIYTEHPFIQYFATIMVNSVEELIEKKFINYFYKRKSDAQYY